MFQARGSRTLLLAPLVAALALEGTATAQPQLKPKVLPGTVLAFSPDGKSFVLKDGGNPPLVLCERRTAKPRLRFNGPEYAGAEAAWFSNDGKRLVVAWRGERSAIRIYDPLSGKNISSLEGSLSSPRRVALSPDGKLIAATIFVKDKTYHLSGWNETWLWDVGSGKKIRHLEARGIAGHLLFSADGKYLVWERAYPVGRLEEQRGGPPPHGPRFVRLKVWASLREVSTGAYLGDVGAPLECLGTLYGSPGAKLYELQAEPGAFRIRRSPAGKNLLFPQVSRFAYCLQKDSDIGLEDRATGTELHCFRSPHGRGCWGVVTALDGTAVATTVWRPDGSPEGLLWETSQILLGRGPVRWSAQDLNRVWTDLGDPRPSVAARAACALRLSRPQAMMLLRERLEPFRGLGPDDLRKLTGALDDPSFKIREAAGRQLRAAGEDGLAAVQTALKRDPSSLEMERRLDQIRRHLETAGLAPEEQRYLWALEMLEEFATPEACRLLQTLARGSGGAWLTGEAAEALTRMRDRVRAP